MNKRFKTYALVWLILLAVFNILCFVTPNEMTVGGTTYTKFDASFWTAYAFITLAMIGQLFCGIRAFKAENRTKLFYRIPLIRISYMGLIVMGLAGTAVMAIPDLPSWVGGIVCAVVLAFTAMALLKADAAAEEVAAVDQRVSARSAFVRSLTAQAEGLMAGAKTEQAKQVCKKVYEALRYSDPMSNAALAEPEAQIAAKFKEYSAAVANGEEYEALADELIELIAERNRQCKMRK